MDKIKEYLNNLFIGLPENPAVLRAKAELLEMMEDKYEEMLKEGKSETEAFGTVISEFGNLDELADVLGIKEQINNTKAVETKERINIEESIDNSGNRVPEDAWDEMKMNTFLKLIWTRARMMAAGIALFIIFPAVESIFEAMAEKANVNGIVEGSISMLIFLSFVTAGILLCVQSGRIMKTFGYNKNFRVGLSLRAAEILKNQREAETNKLYYMLIAGILLCVFSILPSAMLNPSNRVLSEVVNSLFLIFVAGGVYLLVVRGSILNRYKELSKSKLYNESQTNEINASYFVESNPKKLSGGGLALVICSIALVIVLVFIMMMVALFGAIKSAGSVAKNLLETEIVYQEEELEDLGAYNVDEINKVVFEGDVANIKVGVSDDDQIHVKYSGYGRIPDVSKQGSNLIIGFNNTSVRIRMRFVKKMEDVIDVVCVEIPKEALGLDFEYDVSAGKILMDSLLVDQISIDSDAGMISLNDIVANDVLVDVDAGALKLEDCVIKDFRATVDATAIKADNTSFGNAEIETGASAVDIDTLEGSNCYGFDVDTDFAAVQIGNSAVIGGYKSDAKDTSNGDHFIRIKADAATIRVR